MRLARLTLLFAFIVAPAASEDHAVFHGTWGTSKQCTRTPIRSGGTVTAEPFEISPDWLRHGQFWCRLDWGPVERRGDGFFTAAHAWCGEDSVRGYFLGLFVSGEDLTLRWDFPQSNGPLMRCPEG